MATGGEQAASPLNGVVPPPETRFRPGQSGNPGGRPKGSLTRLERLLLRALKERGEDGLTRRQKGVIALAEDFANGDPKARELIFKVDRPDPIMQVNVGESASVHVYESERVSEAVAVITEVLGDG